MEKKISVVSEMIPLNATHTIRWMHIFAGRGNGAVNKS